MARSRDKQVILDMLDIYREFPFLWDRAHPNYNHKGTRAKGLEDLLHIYRRIEPDATIKCVTKKISNLRTMYHKELKKVNNSKLVAVDNEDVYTPTLWYFDALNFLDGHLKEDIYKVELEAEDSDGEADVVSDAGSEYPSTSENSIVIPTIKNRQVNEGSKKRRTTIPDPQATTVKLPKIQSYRSENSFSIMKEDEWEILGKSIGIQLRNIASNSQLTIAQKLISDTIYYAKMSLLTENSQISVGTIQQFKKSPRDDPLGSNKNEDSY